MNYYYTSDGQRISQATLERRITRAKRLKLERLHGHFCEVCGRNDTIMDMSHTVSIQKAKNARMAELCYDVNNIRILCRECHKKHDGL